MLSPQKKFLSVHSVGLEFLQYNFNLHCVTQELYSTSGVSKLLAMGARFSIVKVVGANLFTYSNDNLRNCWKPLCVSRLLFLFHFQHHTISSYMLNC